jgi:hypothetical protein
MNSTLASHGGHSAKVEIELHLYGQIISVNQVGPGFLFLTSSEDFRPGEGVLIIRVDGKERRTQVNLPSGIAAGSERVLIRSGR